MTFALHTRREFLAWISAIGAQASVTACRQPEEQIVSRVRKSDGSVTGDPLHFATTLTMMGTAFGTVVESVDARPTKVEGNPGHPESLGRTHAFAQAVLHDLYDPERSQTPKELGEPRSWTEASTALKRFAEALKTDGGAACAILTDKPSTLTQQAQFIELRSRFPKMSLVRFDSLESEAKATAARWVFGQPCKVVSQWRHAERVLVLDGDPFGIEESPVRAAADWASFSESDGRRSNRLYAFESCLSQTGSVADHRYTVSSAEIQGLLASLILLLYDMGAVSVGAMRGALEDCARATALTQWAKTLPTIAADLASHRARSLVWVGARQPTTVHALAYWLNSQLEGMDRTFSLVADPDTAFHVGPHALSRLARDMQRKRVSHLLILADNPVFTSPGDVDLQDAITQCRTSIHLGQFYNETSRACRWHLNQAHDLESWSDALARDGTASIVQPLVAPLWDGRTSAEVLQYLLGTPDTAHNITRGYWKQKLNTRRFDAQWREWLLSGVIACDTCCVQSTPPDDLSLLQALQACASADAYELTAVFQPSASVYDGRYGNNGWLQELPCPITKTTWGNPAWISATLAKRLRIVDGQVLRVTVAGRTLEIPAIVVPGQGENTVTLTVGYGHECLGKRANGIGVNVFPLRTTAAPWLAKIDKLERTERVVPIPRTQDNFHQDGRGLARNAETEELLPQVHPTRKFPLKPSSVPGTGSARAWGMVIDLNRCTGCGACVIACQAENNVPVVGKEAVASGRAMHWLRIDRYYDERNGQLVSLSQPIPCQQCENAPCETVCPVGATAHSPEGLNDMVYNRCVGSRYCANNCPFKVRKFNYFEYQAQLTSTERLRMNPEVTVRSRGVMEKCTFCVQRLNRARVFAAMPGAPSTLGGSVMPACAQACPTSAIVFGDLKEPNGPLAQLVQSPRAYQLLPQLELKCRVSYLPRYRNANPALEV